jgi:integrase
MSGLHKAVTAYLHTRRALGFKIQRAGMLLPDFASYLVTHKSAFITCRLACDWARHPVDGHPAWWAQRLSLVRCFAKYLHAEDSRHEIPPVALIPSIKRRAVPAIYSARQLSALLAATRSLTTPLIAATYETLFGLLASTGLRVGEAIALPQRDVDWREGLLVIRETKFGKSREVVLHSSVVRRLRQYAALRDAHHPRPQTLAFFLSSAGTPLLYSNVQLVFQRLARKCGIKGRLHDLRHTFATNTLLRWYRDGVAVDHYMPRLSTYLGHVDPKSTYWYLTATPELLAIVQRKLERAQRSLS